MSADNGTIVARKSNGKFVLCGYFASDDAGPDFEACKIEYDTLEEATIAYGRKSAMDAAYGIYDEYGLRVDSSCIR